MTRILLSTTPDERKVLPLDIIPLLYDVGFDNAIKNRVALGVIQAVSITELANDLIALAEQNGKADIAAMLDAHIVSAFIEDMIKNGSSVGFNQSLPTGKRANRPTKPTLVDNGALSLTVSATYPVGTSRAYIRAKAANGGTLVFVENVTDVSVTPQARNATITLPDADTYTVQVATLEAGNMLGFLSPLSDAIVMS